jgi:N-acyl-D-amino-acid deacylase
MSLDLLISNATIIDGTGQPAWLGDIGIGRDRIISLGRIESSARRTIDATGRVVMPGLIDPHSHADLIFTLPLERQMELLAGKVTQGITTTLVGNCGLGVAPYSRPSTWQTLRDLNGWMSPADVPDPWPWHSIADYLDFIAERRPLINVGTLAPHGPIRIEAMGLAKGEPSASQLRAMRQAVDRALSDGAFGLSTGLIYPPGMYSSPMELMELARVVAGYDRIYTSHIRGSSETLIPAVRELVEVGRQTGVRIHHSHNEAVGRSHWPKIDEVLAIEEAAIAEGVRLSFDMFPYTAAATMMIAIYPPWALEGGIPALLDRLQNPRMRRRIEREIERHRPSWPPWREGGWPHNLVLATSSAVASGWDAIRIGYVESRRHKRYQGLSLTELGVRMGASPFDAISDLIIAERGQVSMLIFEVSGDESSTVHLQKFARHRRCAFCTDADDYGHGLPHPAAYGAFPRLLSRFGDEGIEELIHRMTLFPAQIFGIRDRGVIRPGAFADIVICRLDKIRDRATWKSPRRHATGIERVLINGVEVLADQLINSGNSGNSGNSASGRVLRHI